jgi:chloramphenicol-sensitive protein RarD
MTNRHSKSVPLVLGVLTYIAWGSLPLFWKLLKSVAPEMVLANRILWGTISLFLYILILNYFNKSKHSKSLIPKLKECKDHLPSALTLSVNWGVYIWAVNNNYILASSLGYFLSPILYLIAGALVFKEALSTKKKVAGVLGFVALLPLILKVDVVTAIVSVAIGSSIVIYGIFRKTRSLEPLRGVYIESLILTPLAALYIHQNSGEIIFPTTFSTEINLLLCLSGLITALPLITYGKAILSISLTEMALLQYISPVLQFLLAYFYFNEEMSPNRWATFFLVWLAIAIMIWDMFKKYKVNNALV